MLLMDQANLMVTTRDGMAFWFKLVVNTKPMIILKREESPSAGIFTTKAERNPSVNNFKFQHHRWHSSMGSTTVSNRDDLKANS